jgi:hypothetical protein
MPRLFGSAKAYLSAPLEVEKAFFWIPFLLFGLVVTSRSVGSPAIDWMNIYRATDFADWGDLWQFLVELRTGISPIWAALEIVDSWFPDTSISVALYRSAMVGSYILAMLLFCRGRLLFFLTFITSVIFLWATVVIHKPNPQVVDIYLPFFILLSLYCLRAIRRYASRPRMQLWLCFMSGLLLSIAELTRPFVLLILPFFLFAVYHWLKEFGGRHFVVLIVPLLLLSGTWHTKLLVMHGQILSSNHGGYNLKRGWAGHVQSSPRLESEESHEIGIRGRWTNLNTEVHQRNSQRLGKATLAAMIRSPMASIQHGFHRLAHFLRPQTSLLGRHPDHFVLGPYAPAVWLTSGVLFLNFFAFLAYFIRRKPDWKLLGDPSHLLMFFAVFNLLVVALGEAGEEARLLVSVLPFLAALPGFSDRAERSGGSSMGDLP